MSDETEFNRIKVAMRGSLRLERDDYVIIAHCHTVTLLSTVEIRDTRWYLTIYCDDRIIARKEVCDPDFSYSALETFIVGVIANHRKQMSV